VCVSLPCSCTLVLAPTATQCQALQHTATRVRCSANNCDRSCTLVHILILLCVCISLPLSLCLSPPPLPPRLARCLSDSLCQMPVIFVEVHSTYGVQRILPCTATHSATHCNTRSLCLTPVTFVEVHFTRKQPFRLPV